MQIQRIQTLWLVLSIIAAAISFAFPWLKIGDEFIGLGNDTPLIVLGILALALPAIGIFLFRNLKRQKNVCKLAALFALSAISYTIVLSIWGPNTAAEVLILGPSLMVLSGIFDYMALKGICHDEKLLRDSDRLR